MWKKFLDLLLRIFDLVRTMELQSKRISALEKQVDELQQSLALFALANQKDREREEMERELLRAQMENMILRLKLEEREQREQRKQLPPPDDAESDES